MSEPIEISEDSKIIAALSNIVERLRGELTAAKAEVARQKAILDQIELDAPPTPEQWHAVNDERDTLRTRCAELAALLREAYRLMPDSDMQRIDFVRRANTALAGKEQA